MRAYVSMIVCFIGFFLPNLSAQCIQGNCYDGQGTALYPSGAKYVGSFREGKIHGHGTLYFSKGDVYVGDWVEHYRHGTGKLSFANGNEYEGSFKDSRIKGMGTMKYTNGDRYTGNWEHDQPFGQGKYFFNSGDRYEGSFKAGKFEGQGTMFYTDGSRFEGNWKKSKKHGEGVFVKVNGQRQFGEWENGTIQAAPEDVTEDLAEKDVTNCNTVYCASGLGTYAYPDGSKYFGNFDNGQPNGTGTVYYSNGDKYIGAWSQHAPHGKGTMYFANGRVFGGFWNYGTVVSKIENGDGDMERYKVETDVNDEVKIWAVIVGVASYLHLPTLKYTDNDAFHMHAFMKSPKGGALPDEQIKLLIDEDATRHEVLKALQQTLLKADRNDVVVFYFSGHGLQGSFLPIDYNGFENKIHHSEVKEIFEASQAKHKIIFADACHSGSYLAKKGGTKHSTALHNFYNAFEQSAGGLALMMSSKGEEYSLEDGGLRSGIFSYYLMKGLKGLADSNNNRIVSVSELFNYVSENVRSYTAGAQTPTLTGNFDKNMPVAIGY